jgi:hypothetical protein
MGIPETQLETWSHQGAIVTAKKTADSIKNALNSYADWPKGVEFEVYLQGSYKNDTNIRGDSDVDVVAQLNTCFYSNLSEEQKEVLKLTSASYHWADFRADAVNALKTYYGLGNIVEGNKSVKILASAGRLPADVVICTQYREYKTVSNNDYIEGISFWTKDDNRQVINYPKAHYGNGVTKHQNSSSWYKPIVRLFKNCRGSIQGDATPSYFLECTLYNVTNSKLGQSYGDTFCNIVNWLNEADMDGFLCQNEQQKLFGDAPEQWSTDKAKEMIKRLISLWNSW